LVYVKKTHHT